MPIHNLLEYSGNYSMRSGRLWNYYRDEIRMKIIKMVIIKITSKQKQVNLSSIKEKQ